MANEQNLVKFGKDKPPPTSEEAKIAGQLGGIASGIARRQKKTLAEICQTEFIDKITDGKFELGKGQVLTWNTLLKMCMKESPIRTMNLIREATSKEINVTPQIIAKKSFEEFVLAAGLELPIEGLCDIIPFIESCETPRMIMGSRKTGKSYTVACWVAYRIYKDGGFSCLISSKSISGLSRTQAIIERLFIANEVDYSGGFNNGLRVAGSSSEEPNILCLPTASKGLRSHHPTFLWGDDVVNDLDRVSEAERIKTQNWWEEAQDVTQNILLVGQPVSPLDLYEKLKGSIPLLEIPYGKVPSRDPDMEVLKKTKSMRSIRANYYLDVSQEKSGMPFAETPVMAGFPQLENMDIGIDPSAGKGDYTAIVAGGLDNFGKYHAVGFCFDNPYWECYEFIKWLGEKIKAKNIYGEINGIGAKLVTDLRDEGLYASGYHSTNNKHEKIQTIGDRAKDVILYQVENMDGEMTEANDIFNSQVRQYQFKASHDDAPDALVSLLIAQGFNPMGSEFFKNA
jgi:hypothetical protein